jgi:hypothetical protein
MARVLMEGARRSCARRPRGRTRRSSARCPPAPGPPRCADDANARARWPLVTPHGRLAQPVTVNTPFGSVTNITFAYDAPVRPPARPRALCQPATAAQWRFSGCHLGHAGRAGHGQREPGAGQDSLFVRSGRGGSRFPVPSGDVWHRTERWLPHLHARRRRGRSDEQHLLPLHQHDQPLVVRCVRARAGGAEVSNPRADMRLRACVCATLSGPGRYVQRADSGHPFRHCHSVRRGCFACSHGRCA